jgi:hypothetical protein
LAIPWDELRDIPLFVYEEAFQVEVRETHLGDAVIKVKMKALLSQNPLELHVSVDGLQERENCGRALALLFPAASEVENRERLGRIMDCQPRIPEYRSNAICVG